MRASPAAVSLLVLALAALPGCTTRADLDQLNQNQFALRGMIASERQRIDALEQRLRRLNDEIVRLRHAAESGAGGGSAEVKALKERIEKLDSDIGALQAAVAATPAMVPPGAPAMPGSPAAGAAAVERPPSWPNDLVREMEAARDSRAAGARIFREGLAAMNDGKYSEAILKFAQLKKSYPKSPLVEPATYFEANALYEIGRFDQAILQFNDLVMRYPKGRYASAALLRQAQAFLRLNDRIDARLTLQKLVADHPGSPEASQASEMLRTLVSG